MAFSNKGCFPQIAPWAGYQKRFIISSQEVQQSPKAKPQFFYGYIMVVAAFSITLVMLGAHTTFGVFFNPLLAEFGWTRAITSGAFSLSWIVQGLLGIAVGRLNDRLGPRVVITLCGLLSGLGYLLMAQTSAVWQIYLFYGVIIGSGRAGAWVPLMSTVARWFVKRRSMATGIVAAGMGVGILVASPVANWLISIYDWRVSYIILGSIVLVLTVLAAQFLKRDPTQVGQLPYGESEEEHGLRLGAEGFSLREAVYTKQFWLVLGILFSYGFPVMAIMVHIVPHAIELGISAASAAMILAAIGGMSIVGKVALGGLADRIGNKQTFIIGFVLLVAALLWLAPAKEVWILYLAAIVLGFAYGGCAASGPPLVAALFGLRSSGLILGVIDLGYTIGAGVGPLVAGYVYDVTLSYQVAFLACAAMGVVGLILSTLLAPTKTR